MKYPDRPSRNNDPDDDASPAVTSLPRNVKTASIMTDTSTGLNLSSLLRRIVFNTYEAVVTAQRISTSRKGRNGTAATVSTAPGSGLKNTTQSIMMQNRKRSTL